MSSPGTRYLPTLDGWRAISIVAVMFCHDDLHRLGPLSTSWLYQNGGVGVDVFFAISGLLICSRLLVEEQKNGSISISNFYLRRAFRILPPAIVYLAALLLLAVTIGLPVALPEVLASIFFLRNYTSTFTHFQSLYPYYTSHFWSLAVEEHFYLFLPALLVLAPRRWRLPSLLTLAALVMAYRFRLGATASHMHTTTRLDALLVPAAFAILLRKDNLRETITPWLRLWPVVALVLVAAITFGQTPRLTPILLSCGMPLLVMGTMLRPASLFSRFLELPPIRYIGRLSYSIYLWHVLFYVGHFGARFPRIASLQIFPYNLLLTIACALLSYYLVEQPSIRIGHRIASRMANRLQSLPQAV